jgi:A/G-specific adenine glycosylase
LLTWYDRHGRHLPWRAAPGLHADPYGVWLSEIMLQQTTVAAVIPYYQRFLTLWPRVEDLAAASLDDVLTAWAGLGYYARARNLHRAAAVVAEEHGGRFPDTETALLKLPGIGPYTAAAIAAIAFDRPATVVDGNVERVVARLFAVETPLPAAKAELRARTEPRRAPKAERPTRRAVIFWIARDGRAILLRRRPPKGLLGGMMEIPSTPWRAAPWREAEALSQAPIPTQWTELPGLVRHTFTHFHLELTVWAGRATVGQEAEGHWVRLDDLGGEALPSVMRKVVRHALQAGL